MQRKIIINNDGKIIKKVDQKIKNTDDINLLVKEIFKNPRVREALSYAYDHEWINKVLYNNAYTRTDSYFDNSPLASSGLPSEDELSLLNPWKNQLPEEVFTTTFAPPISDGSGMPRENLRTAKKILEEEGWFVEDGKLMKEGKVFFFEFYLLKKLFHLYLQKLLD